MRRPRPASQYHCASVVVHGRVLGVVDDVAVVLLQRGELGERTSPQLGQQLVARVVDQRAVPQIDDHPAAVDEVGGHGHRTDPDGRAFT